MKKSSRWIMSAIAAGAALLSVMSHTAAFAQSYTIRPTCNSTGECKADTATFGFNETNWRQWPLQPRPEQRNSRTIGGTVIPTPPPVPTQPLPRADNPPAQPPLFDGSTGGTILPFPGPVPGSSATPNLKIDSGTTNGLKSPNPNTPTGKNPQVPAPKGLRDIPEALDFVAPQPDTQPKGSGIEPLTSPKSPLTPKGNSPEILTPTPDAPVPESPKSPDKPAPALKSPDSPLDAVPPPAVKPDELLPTTPIKGNSLSRRKNDPVAARATTTRSDLPIQADWNATLDPQAVGDNRLRNTSFEQYTSEAANPLRCGLGGYCPIQLRENSRWVAGNPNFQTSYQGQVFHFSSNAARKRFEASPDKYAPAQKGKDVVLTVEENRTVSGSVSHSAVWHGRLYLFSTSATLAKFQEDPARYANDSRHALLQLPADSL